VKSVESFALRFHLTAAPSAVGKGGPDAPQSGHSTRNVPLDTSCARSPQNGQVFSNGMISALFMFVSRAPVLDHENALGAPECAILAVRQRVWDFTDPDRIRTCSEISAPIPTWIPDTAMAGAGRPPTTLLRPTLQVVDASPAMTMKIVCLAPFRLFLDNSSA